MYVQRGRRMSSEDSEGSEEAREVVLRETEEIGRGWDGQIRSDGQGCIQMIGTPKYLAATHHYS